MPEPTSGSDIVWKRFFWATTGAAAAIVGVVYAFVVLVDPWNTLPLTPPLDRAPVTSNQRFAYPSLARSPRFDSAVFGTSSSRLLRPETLNELFHAHFANLAMNDATAYEQARLMSVFLRAHPTVRFIIIGIDVRLCETGDRPKLSPRPFPEWMYGDNPWLGYGQMLNMFAIQEAGKEFGVLTKIKKEDQGRDGYTVFVPPDDQYDAARAAVHLREDGPATPPGDRTGLPSSWRFEGLEELRPVLAGLHGGTETILHFVPYNRVRLPPPDNIAATIWAECRRHVVELARETGNVLVVDFMRPGPITDNDENYWDAQHYRVGVADQVARDLAAANRGETSPDYKVLYAPK